MPDAIVAVGGTGKRAALLYLKLVNTLRPANVAAGGRNVFILDMEPQPNTTDGEINEELRVEGVPGSHFISPVPPEARIDRTITLSRFMGFGQGQAGGMLPLAHTLFNNNQLNVQIIKGMNCEPTVGATVAARRFIETGGEIQYLENRLAAFNRVIVVGSIIGGTGAGVTPELVRWANRRLPGTPVYGVLFLKWIEIPEGDIDEPNDVKMAGNIKAWLNYLIEHHPENPSPRYQDLFNHYVLVGTPEGMPLNNASSNDHHPVHLLGALYLLQFDDFLQRAPGASGPHYVELGGRITPDAIQLGTDTMGRAVVREKLLGTLLKEFGEQQPDEALSPFTLFKPTSLAWRPFINTLEKIAAKWNRGSHVSEDWRSVCSQFDRERKNAEDRVEEIKKLTATMAGAREIFDFDWVALSQRAESRLPDARRMVERELREPPVAFPGHEPAIEGVAQNFIVQLRSILRQIEA
jgi:hypothetical protein